MCKRWLATVIQWSPRRTAVWRHGGRRPRWLVEHIYVCVWFCACGWDGGAGGIQFGGWVDPVGLAASLNQENEWEPTLGVTPFLSRWLPLISLSLFCSFLLLLAPEAKKTVEIAKINRVFDNMFDGMLQGCLTVFNDLNQRKERQMFISFDEMIRNPFKVQWSSLMCQKFWAFGISTRAKQHHPMGGSHSHNQREEHLPERCYYGRKNTTNYTMRWQDTSICVVLQRQTQWFTSVRGK